MSKRRDLAMMAAIALLAPLAGRAQEARKVRRVGWLSTGSPATVGRFVDAFRRALHDLGYVEGHNLVFEVRWAEGHPERYPVLAGELVARKPDVLVTTTTPAIHALKARTSTIPIVMVGAPDPVAAGFAASLARPGGNVTGTSLAGLDLTPKFAELLRAVLPRVARVAFFMPANNPFIQAYFVGARDAAKGLNITLIGVTATSPKEIQEALAALGQDRIDAFIMVSLTEYFVHRKRIVELAADAKVPGIYGAREFVEEGGLMSYGSNLITHLHLAAGYVDRILKGADPRGLPIQQPTEFELVINLNAAAALGLTIPQWVQIRADTLIR